MKKVTLFLAIAFSLFAISYVSANDTTQTKTAACCESKDCGVCCEKGCDKCEKCTTEKCCPAGESKAKCDKNHKGCCAKSDSTSAKKHCDKKTKDCCSKK